MQIGVWQGRFQYIHNGHVNIFENILLKEYSEKFITIVNPNPQFPPRTDYDRFNKKYNPFTFFQRMLLWKKIADEYCACIDYVPCWHAKYKIALENEFFPDDEQRYWIIPVEQDDVDQQNKAECLKAQGERVRTVVSKEQSRGKELSSSMVRNLVENEAETYAQYIPECICKLTMSFSKGEDPNYYYAVPYIGDTIDISSIQYAINKMNTPQNDEGQNYIVFVISVKVSGETKWKDEKDSNAPWWFRPAIHDEDNEQLTYYVKSQVIHQLMQKLGIINYLITPLFVMDQNFHTLSDYSGAFLPPKKRTKWIVNKSIPQYYKYNFSAYLKNRTAVVTKIQTDKTPISETIESFFSDEDYAEYCFVVNKEIDQNESYILGTQVKTLIQALADNLRTLRSDDLLQRAKRDIIELRAIEKRVDDKKWRSESEFDHDCQRAKEIDQSWKKEHR